MRIAAGKARLLLACDAVTAGSFDSLAKLGRGRTRAVVNRDVAPTAAFTLDGDTVFDRAGLFDAIREAAGHNLTELVDATRTATALLGDAIATNMFMVGYAAQRGLLPVSIGALERAIELNGVAVEANKQALGWGRVQAARPDEVRAVLDRAGAAQEPESVAETFEEIVEDRTALLTAWQDAAYAERYRALVARAEAADRALGGLPAGLRRRGRARSGEADGLQGRVRGRPALHRPRLRGEAEGAVRGRFPALLPPRGPAPPPTRPDHGRAEEAQLRTVDDGGVPRARADEAPARRAAGSVRAQPRPAPRTGPDRLVRRPRRGARGGLTEANYETAVALASLPEKIRGYGPVKARSAEEARREEERLRRSWPVPPAREEAPRPAEELIPAR